MMAIYDFICPVCEVVTEARRGMDTASIPCPACGSDAPRASFYRPAIVSHEGPGNWNVKTADGKYRLTHYLEAQAESAYYRSRE